jgi:hypothetical protein
VTKFIHLPSQRNGNTSCPVEPYLYSFISKKYNRIIPNREELRFLLTGTTYRYPISGETVARHSFITWAPRVFMRASTSFCVSMIRGQAGPRPDLKRIKKEQDFRSQSDTDHPARWPLITNDDTLRFWTNFLLNPYQMVAVQKNSPWSNHPSATKILF